MSNGALVAGQAVILSDVGHAILGRPTRRPILGIVAKAKPRYPDSISVVAVGAKLPRHYHRSYWVAMN